MKKDDSQGRTARGGSYWLLFAGLVFYAAICFGVALYQRHMIYVPPHFTAEHVDQTAADHQLKRWRNPSGLPIGMERLSPKQPAIGTVLIVYGNASWSVGCARYADDLQKVAAVDVYLLEYPGYADRPGSPSQSVLFQAADEAMILLATNQPVYVLGESLGTGVAAHLAGTFPHQVAGLILLSPYDRLTGVAQRRMPWLPVGLLLLDRFPAEDYLRQYHGPVGISVDGGDNIVPEEFGRRLYDSYAGPKHLWSFPQGGHISIGESPARFWTEVLDFWRGQPGSPMAPTTAQ